MAVFPAAARGSAKAVSTDTKAILDVLERYRLDSTSSKGGEGRSKFIPIIQSKVEVGVPIHLVLPGFPFKSPDTTTKVLGTFPDKTEEFALAHLNSLCKSIEDVYKGGAELTIVSDGLVYNDLLGVPDYDIWVYSQAIRKIAQEKGFTNLKFARLHTLQHVGIETESLTEEAYLQQATVFREKLQSGLPTKGIAEYLARDEDARETYSSYISILADDLANTDKIYREITAKRMISRGRTFAAAIQKNFPESIRLSIHPGSSNNKFYISLLPVRGLTAAAWQTTLVFSIDGSILTAHQATMEASPNHELIYRNGKPWFFREKSDLYTWEDMDVEFEPLYPFGLTITPAPGAAVPSLVDVNIVKLRQLVEVNSPIVIRGFRETGNHKLFFRKASGIETFMSLDKQVDEVNINKSWRFNEVFKTNNQGLVNPLEEQLDENDNSITAPQASRAQRLTTASPPPKNISYIVSTSPHTLFIPPPSPHTAESPANTTRSASETATFNNVAHTRLPLALPQTASADYNERQSSRTLSGLLAASIGGSNQGVCDIIEEPLHDRHVFVSRMGLLVDS